MGNRNLYVADRISKRLKRNLVIAVEVGTGPTAIESIARKGMPGRAMMWSQVLHALERWPT
jgi:hypothetical protein